MMAVYPMTGTFVSRVAWGETEGGLHIITRRWELGSRCLLSQGGGRWMIVVVFIEFKGSKRAERGSSRERAHVTQGSRHQGKVGSSPLISSFTIKLWWL